MDEFDQTPLRDGQKIFLISSKWLARAITLAEGKADSSEHKRLGPVDNNDIIDESFTDATGFEFSAVKPGLSQPEHFQFFSEKAWNLIVGWHSLVEGQFPLTRLAHNTADEGENIQVEVFPPVLRLHRLWSATSTIPIDAELKHNNPAPPCLVKPAACLFNDFLKDAKKLLSVELMRKVRVWRLPQQLPSGADDISARPQDEWKCLVDIEAFCSLEDGQGRDKVDFQDQTANPNYNGRSSTLALAGLATSMSVVLDEEVESGSFVSTFTALQANKSRSNKMALMLPGRANHNNNSSRSSPVSMTTSGVMTRGRAKNSRSRRSAGTCGLQNLGNTCYMNSAVQCLRNVEELTGYFLTREAEKEINTTNVLGHNGDIARAYGRLLDQFYSDSSSSYVVPRQFKSVIGRYGPMFSGYGQQDSQEFLGFLLDGLQEDLSRVKKKPYIEKPDSTDEMVNNPILIAEMAQKVWDITKKRDDSVIADLFVGMYKSTLKCPDCSKVSITFDPFNNLTLQLPVKDAFRRSVRFFPLNDRPVNLNIDVDRNTSISGLKEFISPRVGVPADCLVVAENFGHKFYAIYNDRQGPVHEKIQANDYIDVFELERKPSNWPDPRPPQERKGRSTGYNSYISLDDETGNSVPRWNHPMADCMMVPVIYRKVTHQDWKSAFSKRTVVDPPHFIVLSPQEARNEDVIKRKVLQKMATFSNWKGFKTDGDGESAENTEPEMIASGCSDGISLGEGKVQAKSVDGEEDMVDVSMDERRPGREAEQSASGYVLSSFTSIKKFYSISSNIMSGNPPALSILSRILISGFRYGRGPIHFFLHIFKILFRFATSRKTLRSCQRAQTPMENSRFYHLAPAPLPRLLQRMGLIRMLRTKMTKRKTVNPPRLSPLERVKMNSQRQ